MTDKKRGGKTKYRLPQSWRSVAAALLVMTVLVFWIMEKPELIRFDVPLY